MEKKVEYYIETCDRCGASCKRDVKEDSFLKSLPLNMLNEQWEIAGQLVGGAHTRPELKRLGLKKEDPEVYRALSVGHKLDVVSMRRMLCILSARKDLCPACYADFMMHLFQFFKELNINSKTQEETK